MANITLLSDLGTLDPSVAIAKGILMRQVNPVNIIDISHDVLPFNMLQAAYFLWSAYKNFPAGTCHLPLFDIFSEKKPALILAEYNSHYFLAPDNGILPLALHEKNLHSWLCFELKKTHSFRDWIEHTGTIVQQLQTKKPGELGLPHRKLKMPAGAETQQAGIIDCEVVHIDQFENVVINFTRKQYEELSKGRPFKLKFIQFEEINEISVNYNDVRNGNKLCRFNSNDYLEICVNRRKAATVFGLRIGSKHNKIQISFHDHTHSTNDLLS